MRAFYDVLTCCGDFVARLEREVPADCTDPEDWEFCQDVLADSDYGNAGTCGSCGDRVYRISFAGYVFKAPAGTTLRVDGADRDDLIEALEAALRAVTDAPADAVCIEVDDKGGRVL